MNSRRVSDISSALAHIESARHIENSVRIHIDDFIEDEIIIPHLSIFLQHSPFFFIFCPGKIDEGGLGMIY